MKTAVLYAGQGAQYAGMGQDLYEKYDAFRQVIDQANDTEALGFDLKEISFTGGDGRINQTEYTQPCMVAFACGVNAILREAGFTPDYAAGLSLGEYSALEAAGVFDAQTVIRLAAFRGKAMMRSSEGVTAGMTAILKLDADKLAECCRAAAPVGVAEVCNYNYPGQIVIGGEKAAVDEAARLALEAGAKRAIPLNVSGPFHTTFMKQAGDDLAKYFEDITFAPMQFPVLFNCLGKEKDDAETIQSLLVRQVQSSVHMEDILRRLQELGVERIVEVGPGKTLTGFVKKTLGDSVTCLNIEKAEDVEAVLAALKA